jgi:hypothetical protein
VRVKGFVSLATETGEWLYFAPADVKHVQFNQEPSRLTEKIVKDE